MNNNSSEDITKVREMLDRGLIYLLQYPLLLKQLLLMADIDLADRLDFTTAKLMEGTLVPPDLQKLESDLIYEVNYASENGTTVTVYLMQENQTNPDDEMSFRILCYMVEFWRRKQAEVTKKRKRSKKHAIIPIVFYVGDRKWEMKPLVDCMDVPAELHMYVPQFQILYINLQSISDDKLASTPLGAALRITKDANSDTSRFEEVVASALTSFERLPIEEKSKYEVPIIQYVINVVQNKRSLEEEDKLYNIMENALYQQKKGVIKKMAMTPAEFYTQKGMDEGKKQGLYEGIKQGLHEGKKQGLDEGKKQGLDEGKKQGLDEGIKQGRTAEALRLLIKLCTKRFGNPTPATLAKINSIQDPEELEDLCERIDDVKGWYDLVGI